MTRILEDVLPKVRDRFPSLDVRTDQCDIIRIITKTRLMTLRESGGEFVGSIYALDGDCDFETPLVREYRKVKSNEFAEVVIRDLATIMEGPSASGSA